MGPPVSPIVANLYMEYFEKKSSQYHLHPLSRLWMKYVDETFVIQQEGQKKTFLEHSNKVDLTITFTVEGNQGNSVIPFLDTLVKPEANNTFINYSVQKPNHTNQYLQWDSHHNLAAKYSVISNTYPQSQSCLH